MEVPAPVCSQPGSDLSRFSAVLLDLDGVLYVEHEPIPGAADAVRARRVRPDGSGMRRVVRGKLQTWAPDGRRFAYTDGRDIWSIRVDGRGRRRVLRCPDDTTVAGLAWCPTAGGSRLSARSPPTHTTPPRS